jgi:hypothetical protein
MKREGEKAINAKDITSSLTRRQNMSDDEHAAG